MNKIRQHIKHSFKESFFSGRTIATVLILLLIIKQIVVYAAYGSQIQTSIINTLLIYLWFFGNDLMIFGIILLFVFINLNHKNKVVKTILNGASFLLLLLFFVDIITIFFFQSRLSIFELYSFFSTSNGLYFFNYIALTIGLFSSLCITSFFFTQKYFKKLKEKQIQRMIAVRFFCLSLCFSAVNFFSNNNKDLVENILSLNIQTRSQSNWATLFWSGENIKKYGSYFWNIQWENEKTNVILVFAESFSTIDSKRAGGLYDNLPLFDKIQKDGITFTNFIANWCTSETAHIALLQWVEPRETPLQNSTQSYDKYIWYTSSLPVFFNSLWYQTTFLSAVGLDFLNQRDFLSWLQFQKIIGEEEFKNEKKYVFNAAPDNSLYNKAIDIVKEYQTGSKPYFLAMQTISSHRPYDTPYGSKTDEMFKYVDRSMYAFYQKLKQTWFFNNGVLIIVGDHRKMEAISKVEFDKFGMSTHSRAVATIIGTGIKANTFNSNIIQHTDIFNSLKYLVGNKNTTVSKLFNNAFTNESQRDRWVRYCRFAEKTYAVIKKNWTAYRLTPSRDFPIISYINSYKYFQAEHLLWLTNTGSTILSTNTEQNSWWYTIIAHAGGPYKGRLANAAATFQRARQDGVDGIEFDVSYTKDNKNIIMHWPSLITTVCWPNKAVTGYTLSELKKTCKIRNGEEIQTLEEFLTRVQNQFDYFFLEIKVHDQSKSEQQTLDAIDTVLKLGLEDKVIFISYDRTANYIIWSHKKIRAWRDSYYAEEVDLIHDFPHEFYLINKDIMNKDTVKLAQAMNKKFVVYTVNTKEDFDKVSELWAKMIMTDNPPLIESFIKNKEILTK